MDLAPVARLAPRVRRAIALIAIAVVVVAAAAFFYLHPGLTAKPSTARAPNPLFVTPNPVTYDFVTPTMGWAVYVTVRPPHTPGQFGIFRTVDGAKHWEQQLVGQGGISEFSPISVQLFDNLRGYMAIGGPVEQTYRTDDGGVTWGRFPTPGTRVDAITFSDAKHGWALAATASNRSYLYATEDGGDTWRTLPDPPARSSGLVTRRSNEAWLGSSGSGPLHVHSSGDGGLTWRTSSIPYPADGVLNEASLWDSSVNLLPGIGVLATVRCWCAPTSGYDFISFDRGDTWRFVPSAPGSVAYQDDLHWWVINARTLYKSGDAGQSWTKVSDQLPAWQMVPQVIDAKHAWASLILLGGYGLAVTADGGLHWTRVNVPQPTFPTA